MFYEVTFVCKAKIYINEILSENELERLKKYTNAVIFTATKMVN